MVFDEMMNPYDLIAEMIAHISHLDAFYYNSRTYRDAVQVEEMTEAARMFLESQPFFSGKRTEEITEAIINKGIPLELAEAIRAWDKFDQFFYALELLQLLESFYSWEAVIKSPFVRLQMENTFESLNTNVDQTKVLILPKVPSLSDSITPEDDAQKKRAMQGLVRNVRGKYKSFGEIEGFLVYQPLDYLSSMDLGINTG